MNCLFCRVPCPNAAVWDCPDIDDYEEEEYDEDNELEEK